MSTQPPTNNNNNVREAFPQPQGDFSEMKRLMMDFLGLKMSFFRVEYWTGKMQEKDDILAAKEAIIAAKNTEIAAKDAEIAAKDAEIVAKDDNIASVKAAFIELKDHFKELKKLNAAKDVKIDSFKDEMLTAMDQFRKSCQDEFAVRIRALIESQQGVIITSNSENSVASSNEQVGGES